MKHLIYILLVVTLSGVEMRQCYAQNYAPKDYYLVDSLDLDALTESDKKLIEISLKEYHKAKDDTSKIHALNGICENMMHNDWSRYQFYQHNLIELALKTTSSKKEVKTLRISLGDALNNIGFIYKKKGEYTKALDYYDKSLSLREEIDYKEGIANSLHNIGLIYVKQGSYTTALEHYHKSLRILKELGLKKRIAISLNNIGGVFESYGNYPKALEYYHKSLKIEEQINNNFGVSFSLNNIGVIYEYQGDIPKALEYYHKSLKIREEIGYQEGVATSLNNIGGIYNNQGDLSKALIYYRKSLKIQKDLNDKDGISNSLNNIGQIYKSQGDFSKALEYYYKSLKIREEIGYKKGISVCLNNIGDIQIDKGMLDKAEVNLKRAIIIAQEVGLPDKIKNSAIYLSKLYQQQGNYSKALAMYKLHITMRDSINNEKTQKAVIQQQAKYEYEKQRAVDDAEHEKQIAIEQEAAEKQTILTYSTSGGLGLVAIFLLVVFNRLKVTRKQKNIIEEQKQDVEQQKEEVELAHSELEEKNKEITDSIQYAKRIQNAILPPAKVVKEYLQESFIYYKPKDIVAGDFYWLETVSSSRHSALDAESPNKNEIAGQASNDVVLFAAADCTGHGVPGAMVSVVCNNGLNRSVREYGLTDPGKILDKTREIVIQEFEKSEDEVKDGMDIALCSLKLPSREGVGGVLKYAGAHNPLWIIRPNITGNNDKLKKYLSLTTDNYLLYETKANKQPIGQFDNPEPYTTHTIELQKGDSIYIFSDGYADQFGGEKGKKLKTANFKKLLLSIQKEDMQKQKQLINEAFENWKGDLEQLDDVCVIGVRI